MKKLLYTLLLGLVVVSCDKNEESLLAPQTLSQETAETNVDELIGVLIENLSSFGKSKRGNANVSGKGNDFIAVHIFADSGLTYMTLLDETNDDLCFGGTSVTTVFFDNSQGDGSLLQVENPDGSLGISLQGNWVQTFSGANNTLLELDSDLSLLRSVEFSSENVADFNALN